MSESMVEAKESLDKSAYASLSGLADVKPFNAPIEISQFSTQDSLASAELNEHLTASLQVLTELVSEQETEAEKFDKVFLDSLIARIDEMIASQLDQILHDDAFQELESLWRSLAYLVERTDFKANSKIELLEVFKQELQEDFEDISDLTQSEFINIFIPMNMIHQAGNRLR